ncbi:MAG: hypothetical protein JSU90_09800 [Nitrospiraceae bacterium]|nr:MAG: hypothetical protein JSU90_09800 [Nitrospiraceae bacterium]
MKKNIVILALMLVLLFQGAASAFDSDGEIVFRDALYGAAIGALLGGAVYLADQDDFGLKFGVGVALGTIGGLVYGVMETRSLVELEQDTVRIAVPTPVIEQASDGLRYSASILKTHFD